MMLLNKNYQERQTVLDATKRCAEAFLSGSLDWYTTQEYSNMLAASRKNTLRMRMDRLIENKECCPISFMPLTRETICITKCGHSFSHLLMQHWIQGAHSCPVCREPVSKHDLQVYYP